MSRSKQRTSLALLLFTIVSILIPFCLYIFRDSEKYEISSKERHKSTNSHLQSRNFNLLQAQLGNYKPLKSDNKASATFKKWNILYNQHLRKSGGTAIKILLTQYNNLNENATLNRFNNTQKIVTSTTDQKKSFSKIKAAANRYNVKLIHIQYYPFYTYSYLLNNNNLWNDILLVMLIRNPLERIFSDLLYQGTWTCGNIKYQTDLRPPYWKLEDKLIECLHKPKFRAKFTSNIYSKVLSGVWPYANMNSNLRKRHVDFNPNMTIDMLQYKLAKFILKEFDVVLILEMYSATKLQFGCNGLKNDTLPHSNTGKTKNKRHWKLDNFTRLKNEMIKLNRFDMQLYEYAKYLAIQNVKKCGIEIEDKYSKYLTYNEHNKYTDLSKQYSHKNWKLLYFQSTEPTEVHEYIHQVSNFTEIKLHAIKNKLSYINGSKYGFYVESYLKWKREVWHDILMITVLRNPLQRMLDDLIINRDKWCHVNNTNVDIEHQLMECLSYQTIKSNILCHIFSGTYTNNHVMHSVQYETAKLILMEFDIILIEELWDDHETQLQLKCNGLESGGGRGSTSLTFLDRTKTEAASMNINDLPLLREKLIQLNKYDVALYQVSVQLAKEKLKYCTH